LVPPPFAGRPSRTFSCVTGVDTTTISTENRELPLAKIYENFEIARVLVRLDHVASFIFGASRR